MIFTGRSRGWWAYLPWNLSRAVRCAFSCARFPLFLCSHARLHRSVCFPLFLCHRRHASTVHTLFFFAFSATRSAGSEYCSRDLCFPFIFRVCGCNVIFPVQCVMLLLSFALPLLSRNRHCMTFVRVQRTKATGPVQFLKARTDSLPSLRFL